MFDHVVDDINIDMHTHMVIENDLSVYARNPQVAPPGTVGTSSIPHGCLIPDLLIPESALLAHNFPQGCPQRFIWRQEYCSLELGCVRNDFCMASVNKVFESHKGEGLNRLQRVEAF